jgi:hypothetical protein
MLTTIKHYKDIIKRHKERPDPEISSITEVLALVIDEDVVEVMFSQEKLAAILLSEPKFIRVEKDIVVKPGYKYINGEFVNLVPKKEYPHD